MNFCRKLYIVVCFMLILESLFSQGIQVKNSNMWFINASSGIQMSGIKDEDFIKRNFTPVLSVGIGKWFAPTLALQVGYQGFYFNTIDKDSHWHYDFYYGEAIVNINGFFSLETQRKFQYQLAAGTGYFYNYQYNRPNILAKLGINIVYKLNEHLELFFKTQALMGWDIYQNNEDILPSIVIGPVYNL